MTERSKLIKKAHANLAPRLFAPSFVLAIALLAGCSGAGSQQKSDALDTKAIANPATPKKADANAEPASDTEPAEPEPAKILSETITFESLGDTLTGVVEHPDTRKSPGPAVLILHDAGPHDQQGHFKSTLGVQLPMEVAVYQNIAAHLVKNGFVVMRFNKRTCVEGGRPWCTYPRAYIKSQRANLAEALEADADAALTRLRDDSRVDPSQVYLLGHGQGADLALSLAPKTDPAGLILLAPSPYPVDKLIAHQIDTSLKHLEKRRKEAGNTTEGTLLEQQIEALKKTQKLQTRDFAALRAGEFDKNKLLGAPTKTWSGLIALHERAREALTQQHAPMLAIFGGLDDVLPAKSADVFEQKSAGSKARGDKQSGSLEVIELPQLTHFMVSIDPDADATSVSQAAKQRIFKFLSAQTTQPTPTPVATDARPGPRD